MIKVLHCYSKKWNEYLNLMNSYNKDIYYTSDYYKLCQQNGDGIATLFVYKEEDNIAIYPFMLNEINKYNLDKKYYDIESAYGYCGPLTNSYDEVFLSNFEKIFLKYCSENNIIAEFIRFHPLIRNENIFKTNIDILHNRTTVYLDLTKDIGKIWNEDIKSKNRNMIRKAQKNGLEVESSKDYEIFRGIYFKTMDRVQAIDYYYFHNNYYETVKKSDKYVLLNVKKDNLVIASAIFIKYGDYFHYHLAGSLREYLSFAPNNLLLWEAIKYAHGKGYKKMHFGGGITNNMDDKLFKFKSSFSKNIAEFYIGKRIHNSEVYNYLIDEWEKKNNKKASVLLQYKV